MKIKDQHILNRIKKGDIKSFEVLFHRYYPGMCLYAQSLLKKENVAEEVVQDVFYSIWKNRKNFRLTSGWQSYLYRSVYNNSMNYLRKTKNEYRLDFDVSVREEGTSGDPFEEMNYNELNETIRETMEKLPERTRHIFRLSRFEGLTYKEIAKKLSISVKTVESNMGKALKAFRLSLEEYGYVK